MGQSGSVGKQIDIIQMVVVAPAHPLYSVTFLFEFPFDAFFKVPGAIGRAKSGITAILVINTKQKKILL